MIRVGIAGIGYIAEEYIKLFSQGKIKNAELHALSSRNYAHMEEIKNTYHLTDATLFSDYNAMLASSGIDMVSSAHRISAIRTWPSARSNGGSIL